MKKYVLLVITMVILIAISSGQVYDNAIGLRLSADRTHVGGGGVGAELTYQYGLSESTRLDVGLALTLNSSYDRFGFTAAAHKVFDIESGFSWFVGPGAQIWAYSYDGNRYDRGAIGVALGAQGGVGYDFNELDLPFIVSVDARPMFNLVKNNSGFDFNFGITARYVF